MADSSGGHGSPFPLAFRYAGPPDRGGGPRYLARRRRRHATAEVLVEGGVSALNALEKARGDGVLLLEAPRRVEAVEELSLVQDLVLRNLGRAATACLPQPQERDLCPDGALYELLRAKDVYHLGKDTTVTPYVRDQLAVLGGATHASASGPRPRRGRLPEVLGRAVQVHCVGAGRGRRCRGADQTVLG